MNISFEERIEPNQLNLVKKYSDEYPVKVGELAQVLGLDVLRSVLQPKISGLIQPSKSAKSGFEIKVNKFEAPERQRFTLAHEIAHFLLHRDDIGDGITDSIMYRSNLTSRKEAEANRLAADIIMPSALVREEFRKSGGIKNEAVAFELAERFRVSLPAMKIRLGIN